MLIVGGGVAGLYTAAFLARKGYSTLLAESDSLGAGQTIASQGILHGGIKYTLGGKASEAAKAVAEMPARWRAAMINEPGADLDLRRVRTLCRAQYLWTTSSFFSRVTAKVAATAIRTAVHSVEPSSACEGLHAAVGVDIHQVEEPVIDPKSLVEALAEQLALAGGLAVQAGPDFTITPATRTASLWGRTVSFSTAVLAAGAGNRVLLIPFGPEAPTMQRRPLHMVMARPRRGSHLPELYGHCIAPLSDKPRITVTTQAEPLPGGESRNVWYIGGQIAEAGVGRSRNEQLAAARAEVAACLPWIDVSATEWATFTIDRAEGSMPGHQRPDVPVVASVAGEASPIWAVWPTKLVFAPLVAQMVEQRVAKHVRPEQRGGRAGLGALQGLLRPGIALLPWERGETQWS